MMEEMRKMIISSKEEAILFNDNKIRPGHIILSILKNDNTFTKTILLDFDSLISDIDQLLSNDITPKPKSNLNITLSNESKDVLTLAKNECDKLKDNFVNTIHVVLSIIKYDNNIKLIFNKNKFTYNFIYRNYKELKNMGHFENDEHDDTQKPKMKKMTGTASKTPILDNFSRDLSKAAEEGLLDPVIGRDIEIQRIGQILCRRKKNNPVLIGPAGGGKTTLIDGLAQKIKEGKAPRSLLNKRIVVLDISSVVAGTKYRGQFEERMKGIMDELMVNKDVILFIDEIHSIVGAGNAGGSLDAANIVKPALSRGDIQVIGATTLDEFRENFEKDAALTRRFQQVLVNPPTPTETIEILNNIKHKYEDHHKVTYTDESIVTCVKLAERYITDREFPDKAIDILDEAGARAQMFLKPSKEIMEIESKLEKVKLDKLNVVKSQKYEEAAKLRDQEKILKESLDSHKLIWENDMDKKRVIIAEDDVADVVSMMTGIPLKKITTNESSILLNMEDDLNSKVIGQSEAIKKISKSLMRSRIGVKNPNRPSGSFLFLGNSGVGKTFLSKKLAEHLFNTEEALIRIDMSEYMEKFNISRLVGCFTPETEIQLSSGLTKKISEISIGDKVITHLGNIKKVIDKYVYQNNNPIDSYRISNRNIRLNCTPQHEILAIKPIYYNNRVSKSSYSIKNAKFYNSKDLNVGDILLYPKNINSEKINLDNIIDLNDYTTNLHKYKIDDKYIWAYENKKLNRYITINEDFVRLVGYYLSEGGCSKNMKSVKFTFNIKETDYITETVLLLKKIFGDGIKITVKENILNNSTSIFFSSRIVSIMLSSLFGRTCYDKKLPEFFMKLNNNLDLNLLETMIYGDGTKTLEKKLVYKSVSLDIISQMNMILKKNGYSTQFNKILSNNDKFSTSNLLIMTGLNIEKLNNEFPNLNIKNSYIKPKNIQRNQYQDNEYYYYHILDKTSINYEGAVYDLSIEDDCSYIANGVSVHNSPPGYVGHEEGGMLTEKVRKRPYSVILFDEVEKAHPDVFNLLLQLLDEGHLTDGLGRKVNFKNCLIILTSNIGVKQIQDFGQGVGFKTGNKLDSSEQEKKSIIEKELKKFFRPEFINRIDDIIIFNGLSKDDIEKIVSLELDIVTKRLDEIGYKIKYGKGVKEFLMDHGYNETYGARELNRAIQKYIEDVVAEDILKRNLKIGDTVSLKVDKKLDTIVAL